MDPATGILLCEGDKVGHEWMRFATEMADFVFHVELRLTKVDGEPAYNSGVYVRSSADGKIWVQGEMPPALETTVGEDHTPLPPALYFCA